MQKIGIVTCSTSGLDYIDGYDDIESARTTITIDGKEYVDGINIRPETFYENLPHFKDIPRTAQPSPGQLIDIFGRYREKGYTDIIYLSISDKLSGTYQTVEVVKKSVEGIKIHPFNSLKASYLTGYMAITAHKMAAEGKHVDEIIPYLEKMRENAYVYFAVNDLTMLVKNGRLSNASALMANMLKIKPLLTLNENGEVVAIEKIRTIKKAIKKIVDNYSLETNNGHDTMFSFLFTTGCAELEEKIMAALNEKNIDNSNLITYPISPAVGCHIGNSLIGIGYIKKFD